MLILITLLVTIALFVVLIVIAGIKGFFKGATEEFLRQHGVLTKMVRKLMAKRIWKNRKKEARGLPKEDAVDVEVESVSESESEPEA